MDDLFRRAGDIDLALVAFGVLGEEDDPVSVAQVNYVGAASAMSALAARMSEQGHGTIVVLSSVAAIRPRKFNPVYGATKAALDAFARGLADALHGSGVHVLLVRPGFVTGRMTAGMQPAPLATTPDAVGAAVAGALRRDGSVFTPGRSVVWVPGSVAVLSAAFRVIPRPLWRRIAR